MENAYIAGLTRSDNFPTTLGAYDTTHGGVDDGFITKLNSTGTDLIYSTYLGSIGSTEECVAIAVDSSGKAYVVGETTHPNFPITRNAYDGSHNGGYDIFITKLNTTGTGLFYSTYLGGSGADRAVGVSGGIAVDGIGNAYVTGHTNSSNFPTTAGAYDTGYNGGTWGDVFITKINSSGSTLLYSTFLGGSGDDYGHGITVDGSGNAYVTGYTTSSNFPTTPDAESSGCVSSVFLTKINPVGSSLLHSTCLGGNNHEEAWDIVVDASGNAYITGSTMSSDFPTTSTAFDTSLDGDEDTFIAKFLIPSQLPVFDGHDFDGDSNSDLSIWRPSDTSWYIKDVGIYPWGTLGDVPVNGNYDADVSTEIAVWRPSNGYWYIKDIGLYQWGASGDIPVPGDYDGDNVTDIAVWRPINGVWYFKDGGIILWGSAGDFAVPGDYNGDNESEIAVWRPSNGVWYIKDIGVFQWGTIGDVPVPGDYNGDGSTDIAVWRPSNGTWYIKDIGNFQYGALGDVPVPGQFDPDTATDIAVWRPANGVWYIKDIGIIQWGVNGDIPVVR